MFSDVSPLTVNLGQLLRRLQSVDQRETFKVEKYERCRGRPMRTVMMHTVIIRKCEHFAQRKVKKTFWTKNGKFAVDKIADSGC